MFQKNKKLILITLLIALASAQPAHGISSWVASFLTTARSVLISTLSTVKEYKKATTAIMSLTLGASLVSLFAWHMKKQQLAQKKLLNDETWTHNQQRAQEERLKKIVMNNKTILRNSIDSLGKKEEQLQTLKAANKVRADREAQQRTSQKLASEIDSLKANITQTRTGRETIQARNNPAKVHENLDYWLKHHQESSASAPAPMSQKEQEGTYDKK